MWEALFGFALLRCEFCLYATGYMPLGALIGLNSEFNTILITINIAYVTSSLWSFLELHWANAPPQIITLAAAQSTNTPLLLLTYFLDLCY